MELIQKGEVAWLNASDAPKDKDVSSARRGGRPPAAWRNDDYDDEPSTSRGQGLHILHPHLSAWRHPGDYLLQHVHGLCALWVFLLGGGV